MSTGAVIAIAAVSAIVGAGLGALWFRTAMSRRVQAVTSRLDAAGHDAPGRGLESALLGLERAADASGMRVDYHLTAAGRLVSALGRVPTGLVICDEVGEVVYTNSHAREVLADGPASPIAGEIVYRLLHGALSGASERETIELFGPPRRSLQVTAFPLDDGPRSTGAVAVIDDVTERRRVDAIRRDFVANISHELKTPIGALGLLAETLVDEQDPETVRRFADRMQTEALRVARIIDDLLDLSRIEAEGGPDRDPIPVHLVVAEAVERVRSLAEHRGIGLEAAEPGAGLTVLGDRRQLVSAMHNLLENAVKYSDGDSRVQVRVKVDGDWVEVAVRDHGIGIPTRDLSRIFERFYRVDRARSRETGGTGLGLSIVRHVVTNHGGDVRVTSKEGRGSTFTLRLPLAQRPIQAEAG
ncbi:MAG: ATP-binding protein [Acidimicrobiales bacterium]